MNSNENGAVVWRFVDEKTRMENWMSSTWPAYERKAN